MKPLIATAIIGAGYGDEGKGLLVDALAAARGNAVVVRANGGAQAGHSVTLADGRRHVFHHLGAGALAGAATHLSRFFVHHPMLLRAERAAVAALGGSTVISADPRGLVTTPWDMLVNQALERSRGRGRHGSCGLGFGETIERGLDAAFRLTLADLAGGDLRARLIAIRRDWFSRRLRALGVASLTDAEARVHADDAVLEVFLDDCREFVAAVRLAPDAALGAGAVIFEGAQGLLLDQAIGAFPHVTRSHTGLVNVVAIAREAGIAAIDAVYVSRAYATRHGAGPLAGATDALPGFAVVDPTNAPNPWQGAMRHAPLDLDVLARAIAADLRLAAPGSIAIARSLAVTCLDQALGPIAHVAAGVRRDLPAADFAAKIAAALGLKLRAESWGPRRDDLRFASALAAPAA